VSTSVFVGAKMDLITLDIVLAYAVCLLMVSDVGQGTQS
jgi:hypothetical protein